MRSPRLSEWVLVALATVAAVSIAYSQPADRKAKKVKPPAPAEDLFSSPQMFRVQIEIPEAGMQTLRQNSSRGWNGPDQKRPSVKCTVREGDTVYKDVAVHLKGAAGSFQPIDSHPGLTLNFDKHVKGQTFHGIKRLSLNNSVQDQSLLSEQFCRELFAAGGVPVPRATHAKVQLNGRDLGVYVLTEAFNKQFLARHFKSPDGNLYDGGFLKDITDPLEKSSGPNPQDRSDLARLAEAAQAPMTNRMAALSKVLNLDEFITYLALDIMMCDADGYALNRNNYRMYHDPDSDQFVFMPHGLDQMFGTFRCDTSMAIMPRMQGLVARALLQTPEGRQRYRERLAQLTTNLFHADAMTNRVWELEAKLLSTLKEQGPGRANFQQGEAVNLCRRIEDRVRSVNEQLTAPDRTLKFDAAGLAHFGPGAWRPRIEFGKPVLDEVEEGGKKLLHIRAVNGSVVGLWTTRVTLDPGRYRLEGRVRSQGVAVDAGDRRGGAGLRISGRRFNQKLVGDNGWADFTFDFDFQDQQQDFGFMGPIQGQNPEAELICELRAGKGEAWFDLDSLRLIRR